MGKIESKENLVGWQGRLAVAFLWFRKITDFKYPQIPRRNGTVSAPHKFFVIS